MEKEGRDLLGLRREREEGVEKRNEKRKDELKGVQHCH